MLHWSARRRPHLSPMQSSHRLTNLIHTMDHHKHTYLPPTWQAREHPALRPQQAANSSAPTLD